MSDSSGWRDFFDAHAPHYDENPFAQHTAAEIDFILSLYPIPPGSSVLDLGCGTGRHSVELAKRGFKVTGVDYSSGMLAVAEKKSRVENVKVTFVQADVRRLNIGEQFDFAICLCEGGPGLIEYGEDAVEHDVSIFRRAHAHLKASAPFVLTALNGYAAIRQMKDELIAEGRFDPATMRSNYVDEWDLPEGKRAVQVYERLFIAPEMRRLLEDSGFKVDNIFGGTAGFWAQRPLSLDEVEMMFLCRRA